MYPYIAKGKKVYSLASNTLVKFDFKTAQNTFRNYILLALNNGPSDSNWPILESPSLMHNILALDNTEEIKKFLPYYLDTDSERHMSLKTVAASYKNMGDIWPESFQYSKAVANYSIYLMALLEKYNPTLKLSEQYANILGQRASFYNLTFPNKQLPSLGDGKRLYRPKFLIAEISLQLAKKIKNQTLIDYYNGFIQAHINNGKYNRGAFGRAFYGAKPYLEPLRLLWLTNTTHNTRPLDLKRPKPRSTSLDYAGIHIQRNTSFSRPIRNSLMGVMGGSSYIHGHASGIDMELYGQGYVLGAEGDRSSYRTSIHENYYRLFAAHNTVISNGASASQGGWINVGIDPVKHIINEPTVGEQAISDDYSFATARFDDKYNLVAPAKHERTLALIKLSDTKGYYVDIFRAKSDNANQYHDYIYRNASDAMTVSSNNQPLNFKQNKNRYTIANDLKWEFHKTYEHPSWHYFENVESSTKTTNQLDILFKANKLGKQPVFMKAIVPSGLESDITKVLTPPSSAAPPQYHSQKLPAFVLRKNGDVWQNPFVVLYQSSIEENDFSIASVERLKAGEQFKGLKIKINLTDRSLTQFIIMQENENDIYESKEHDIYFKGRFSIVTLDHSDNTAKAYIGNGEKLIYKANTVSAKSTNKAFAKLYHIK